MNIYVGQVYIEVGVVYPFTVEFQRFIHAELTKRVTASALFVRKYADDFSIMFNMSAKADLAEPEIRGPTVFRKDKDVEYTIFLPFDMDKPLGRATCQSALRHLVDSIVNVLSSLGIDVAQIVHDREHIINTILSDPEMLNLN